MKQEDKQLLLKDLCARLPYGVICTDNIHGDGRISNIDINLSSGEVLVYFWDFDEYAKIENIKSYLRPMSSVTKEEEEGFEELFQRYSISQDRNSVYHASRGDLSLEIMDWLNAHHFDYRGLIEKGLALEAPAGMYK